MCDMKVQEDEGPEEGEIQDDDDDEEPSLYLSSSSSSYERDIRNHERHRAARKIVSQDPTGSISMSIVNDRMLSRTNHERREKSRVRSNYPESSHHKASSQPRSGLTHGKENRHVHQSREGRSPPVHHRSRTKSKTPDRSPHDRDLSKTTFKHYRNVPDDTSSRLSELLDRDVAVPVKHNRRKRRGRRSRRSISSEHLSTAKKPKVIHNTGNGDLNDAGTHVLNGAELNEENSLKRKLLTMGALANQSSTSSSTEVPNNSTSKEVPDNSTETEVVYQSSVPQVSQEKSNEASSKSNSGKEDQGVIFIATVPKPVPELVTLSDSDAEQETLPVHENNDITKGSTDMEMSRSPTSSNIEIDLDSTVVEVPTNIATTSAQGNPDIDDDEIVSLRRAALMSKHKPSKDPPPNAEQDEDDLQLRVAALRSAVMRKAEVRKKRRLQTVGQVLGDEMTPVDMDLADTDDEEESQLQSSPEPPVLPMPPLPSESLLKTINMPPPSCYFPDSAAPHFMPNFLDQPLDSLPHPSELPRFQMDVESAPEEVTSEHLERFPDCPVGHPNEVVLPMDCEGMPLVGPHPASFTEAGFQAHPNEYPTSVQHEYGVNEFTVPAPVEFPVLPVPPPVPIEFPLPLDYTPTPVPPVEYPVNVEYQPKPSSDYDPAIPTPYPDLTYESTPQNFIPEDWNPENNQHPGQLEPLSQILTKAMKRKLLYTRPNLLSIKVNKQPGPPKIDEPEIEAAPPDLSSMIVLDEVADSPVPSPKPVDATPLEESTGQLQRQSSTDEDELFLREKLLKAISSKRDLSQPREKIANKPQDTASTRLNEPSNLPGKTSDVFDKTSNVPGKTSNLPDESSNVPDKTSKPPEDNTKRSDQPVKPTEKHHSKDAPILPASRPKDTEVVPTAKPKRSGDVLAKDRLVYSKENQTSGANQRKTFPRRKQGKQKPKTSPPVFQQPPTTRFIITLGEDSDSSDGLDIDEPEDLNIQKKEPWKQTNMYHMKDYCPRSGAGDSENSKAPEETVTTQNGGARSDLDLSKEVDRFLKDVRSSQEASTPAPESPLVSQVTILKPIHVTPLAVRHLPASKQEEYRKLKQLYAERELQKKTQKPKAILAQSKLTQITKGAGIKITVPVADSEPSKPLTKAPTIPVPPTSPKPTSTVSVPKPSSLIAAPKPSILTTITPTPKPSIVPEGPASLLPTNNIKHAPSVISQFAKKLNPFGFPDKPIPNRATKSDFFHGAPIIYAQSGPPTFVTPSPAPKIAAATSLTVTEQVNRPGIEARTTPVPSTPVPSVPQAKSTNVPATLVNYQKMEKLLEEAEMNLLKERSAVVGQIMGLTRLQDETEGALAAQDACESNLVRILEEFDRACDKWLESSNKVKVMGQRVKEKRDQLRKSYARTEALARSCKTLGAQVKGTAYTLPVGNMMQSKQKAANQQYGRMIKWRKAEQRRMRAIIEKTDRAYAFLKSRCQQPPNVRVNPALSLVNNPVPTTTPDAVAPKLVPTPPPAVPTPPPAVPTPPPAVPTTTPAPTPNPTIVLTPPTPPPTAPAISEPVPPKPETKSENPPIVLPETLVAHPEGNAESDIKNTPSMSCARRLVRVAKRRLREGAKPREVAKQPKMILGEDNQPAEDQRRRKKQPFLTKYSSPLDHLGNTGSVDAFFDPEAILCPYELNGKCEDYECSYQHQAKDTNRQS